MIIQIFNTSRYTKQVFLDSKTLSIKAKHMTRVEVNESEMKRVNATPDFEVVIVDHLIDDPGPLEREVGPPVESSPQANQRPLDEEILAHLYEIRQELAELRRDVSLLELGASCDADIIKNIHTCLREFRGRIDILEQSRPHIIERAVRGAHEAASELLNVEANPQEARRSLFEKLVKQNTEIRKG